MREISLHLAFNVDKKVRRRLPTNLPGQVPGFLRSVSDNASRDCASDQTVSKTVALPHHYYQEQSLTEGQKSVSLRPEWPIRLGFKANFGFLLKSVFQTILVALKTGIIGLGILMVVQVSPLAFFPKVWAATGINEVVNFQGKVVNSDGTNVSDNTYDFELKLYDGAGSGASTLFTESWTSAALFSSTMTSAPGSGGESSTYSSDTNESTLKAGQILWNTTKEEPVVIVSVDTGTNVITHSPTRQAWATSDTITNKIYVNDGVFRVGINSLNQDLSGVDFNTDNIFVGVNFNADGEMKPRIQYTAVPYAMNAGKVAGLTVTDTTGTFTLAAGKTLTVNNSLTFSGTDATTFTFPSDSDTVATLGAAQTLTNKTIGSTGLIFSGASTDITTAASEGLVLEGKAASTFQTTAGNITFQAAGTSTTATVQIGTGGAGSATPDILGLDVKSDAGDPTGANGYIYYNENAGKFRCYQNGGWTNCIGTGGSGLWSDGTTFIYPADTTDDLVVGASTVAGASLYFDEDAGILYLGTNESLSGGLTFYSSGAGITDPTITADASGNLTLSAGETSASVIIGSGTGNITILLSNAADILTADKSVTLGAAYTSDDYTFDRSLTGGSYDQGGTVLAVTDTSGGSGTINPDMFLVNPDLTSGTFTGSLLRLQVSGSDKFVVDANGGLTITGATTDITSASNEDLTITGGGTGDTKIAADADSNFRVVAGAAPGVDLVEVTNSGQGTTTNNVDGLSIDFTQASGGTGETNAGLNVSVTNSGDAGDTLYGVNIAGITGGSATEYALVIGSGWDRGLDVSSHAQIGSTLTATSTVTIGTGGNTFTFNPASGPAYAGTSRPTKTIVFDAEYPGATLDTNGASSTTGDMTSDNTSAGAGENSWMNYYEWNSSEASLQEYSVIVRFTLPADFSAWATSNTIVLDYVTESNLSANNSVTMTVYLESDGATNDGTTGEVVSSVGGTWTTSSITVGSGNLDSCDAAGEACAIVLRLRSKSDNYARVGDVALSYLAQF